MLSRVQQLDQIYILDSLDESKIRVSKTAIIELNKLKGISLNENLTQWLKPNLKTLKVASLNCAGLKPHYIDIQADGHLLKADIIHLIETSIDQTDQKQFTLPGYNSHFISIGNGKGIATFYKTGSALPEIDITEDNMQITKFTSSSIDIINIYRSSNCHSVGLLNNILKIIPMRKPVLITGDFNICYFMNRTNRLVQGLESNDFKQLLKEATHIRGRHIDHAYWKDSNNIFTKPVLERYSPYYSDHDALCLTIENNQKSASQGT